MAMDMDYMEDMGYKEDMEDMEDMDMDHMEGIIRY
jgi:hypothetical protein